MNPKSFHVCKLLISMTTWANRLMLYTMYMHQNINLLLNKAANLGLYDQTRTTAGCWQHDLLSHMRNTRDSERSEQHLWVMGTTTCWAFRAQAPQSGPSKSQCYNSSPSVCISNSPIEHFVAHNTWRIFSLFYMKSASLVISARFS